MIPEPRMKHIEGIGPRMAFEIACHDCRKAFVVPAVQHIKGRKGGEQIAQRNGTHVARALRDAGWTFKTGLKRVTCPSCQASATAAAKAARAPSSVPSPLHETPAPVFSKPVTRTAQETMTMSETPELRRPTREQRRQIMDALEGGYDQKRGLYLRDGSDDKLARMLNVPRAWVSEIRDEFFGEQDHNEAGALHSERIEALAAKLSDIESEFMKVLSDFGSRVEKVKKEVEVLRGRSI